MKKYLILVFITFFSCSELKKTSLSNISAIASEISAELMRKIINTEVNKSNVSAVVDTIIKRNMEKHT